MHIFHRILYGNNVAVAVFVAVAEHGRQCGGFAATSAAGQNNQPALGHHDIFEYIGQPQFLKLWNLGGDGTQHHADPLLLHKHIDAKATDAGWADSKVAFVGGFKFCRLAVVHDAVRKLERVRRRKHLLRNRRHLAVHLERRWEARADKQVGRIFGNHPTQQVVY